MPTYVTYKSIMLWRHADALPIGANIQDDISRPLSKKGQHQAKIMAAWLKSHSPKEIITISSKAVRSQQTAKALTNDFILSDGLAPGVSLMNVLETINGISDSNKLNANLLIVGHQPWLGELAAYLLNPLSEIEGLNIKKAALWWFKRARYQSNDAFDLITVQTPSLL
jgi:phosphohistidine phosphatase